MRYRPSSSAESPSSASNAVSGPAPVPIVAIPLGVVAGAVAVVELDSRTADARSTMTLSPLELKTFEVCRSMRPEAGQASIEPCGASSAALAMLGAVVTACTTSVAIPARREAEASRSA